MMRKFILTSFILFLFFQVIYSCTEIRVRKEIRDLSPTELSKLHAVFKVLNTRAANATYSLWDLISNLHLSYVPYAHGVPSFLPWHRYFIWYVESIVREIDPSVTIPYWDWSVDSQAPENSIVFTNDYFGGNGDPSNAGCLSTGPYANWHLAVPNGHCLTRSFDGGNHISSFVAPVILALLISGSSDYDALRQAIESTPHAAPHINIGGDMKTMYSPNDPLFYLHHTYLDKLWSEFQSKNNYEYMSAFDSELDPTVNSSLHMVPFNISVSKVLNITSLCYQYAEPLSINQGANPHSSNQVANVSALEDSFNANSSFITAEASQPKVSMHTEVSRSQLSASFLLNSNGTLLAASIFSSNQTSMETAQSIISTVVGSPHSVLQMKRPNIIERLFKVDWELINQRNPSSLDRSCDNKLRIPQPIEEEYIHHMGMNLNAVRNIEAALRALYDLTNNS